MRHLAILALLALAACAGPGAPKGMGGAPNAETVVLASLPARIGGFERQSSPAPDLTPGVLSGAMLRLVSPEGYATVYLYRRSDAFVVDGADSAEARAELAGATHVMIQVRGQSERKGPAPQPVGAASGPGGSGIRCTAIAVPDGGRLRTESVCVTAASGRLLKLRVTTTLAGQGTDAQAAGMIAATGALVLALEVRGSLPGGVPRRV